MEDKKEQFSKIYDEHLPPIYRFIYLKVNTRETAEDLASDVFLRVWNELNKEEQEIQIIRAFLYGIARNVVADHYRGRKLEVVSVEETFDLMDSFSLHDQIALSSDIEQILRALSGINDDYQDLIIWRYVEELSVQEIAQLTGKTEENVRVGIHRAIKNLREQIPAGVIKRGVLTT